MFASLIKFIKTLLSTVTTVTEGVEINAHSFKEISATGLVKAKNIRINAEINAKADQAVALKKFNEVLDKDTTMSPALKEKLVAHRTNQLESTESLDDLLN